MDRVDIVQKLKNDTNMMKNDINYGKVLAVKLYRQDFIYKIAIILKSILNTIEIKKNGCNSKILFIYAFEQVNRLDYNYIADKFCEISKSNKVSINNKFSFKGSLNKVISTIRVYKQINLIKYISIFDRIMISTLISQCEYGKKDLKCHIDLHDIIVTFCDAHPFDNFSTQISNNANKITATLQHGQYKIISKGKETADIEAYLNFTSNYLFAWGEKTSEEFRKIGIESKRLLNAGALKEFSYNRPIDNKNEKGVFGVILDADPYKSSNINLIKVANDIAEKLDLKYILRLHPRNKYSKYEKYVKGNYLKAKIVGIENEKYLEMVDFSIIHIAGVYIELMSMNAPFFIFKDSFTEEIFVDKKLNFMNYEEFRKVHSYFKNNKYEYYKYLSEKYKNFNSYDIENNYKYYINIMKDEIKERN